MRKIGIFFICQFLIIMLLSSTILPNAIIAVEIEKEKLFFDENSSSYHIIKYPEKIQSKDSVDRPFNILTSGIGSSLYINAMLKPWPDQTYFILFGIILYINGNTTIENQNTDEIMYGKGSHIVIFYKFLGPTVDYYDIQFEGNAFYARIIGGK